MTDAQLYCSMCGKSSGEVSRLVAGPQINVCSECIALMAGIVAKEDDGWRKALIEQLSATKISGSK
jgi:ATP-dependent protease Clp ATPase subunit